MHSNKFVLLEVVIVLGVLATVCQGRAAPKLIGDDQYSPAVSRCRTKCVFKLLDRFQPKEDAFEQCQGTPNCYMCWDYCSALYLAPVPLASAMCGDDGFCSAGCIVACKSHSIETFLDAVPLNRIQ